MAGGMSDRPGWGTMAERVAATRERTNAPDRPPLHQTPERSSTAPPSTAPIDPPPLKHCWVTKQYGRVPGLLLEWRQEGAERRWEGRVVHPVLLDDGWELYEEWVGSACIEAACIEPA